MTEKKTRANVPTPPSARRGFLTSVDYVPEPVNNMKGEKLAPMTFNMPRNWHTDFKTTATLHGMNMKELLMECFDAWKKEQRQKKSKD